MEWQRGLRAPSLPASSTAFVISSTNRGMPSVQPELLARHCTEAGLIEKAAGLWSRAGERSLTRSALIEAAEQFKRALDQIATLQATPSLRREQIKLQVALITPVVHIKGFNAQGGIERARLLIEQANALGEPPEDPLQLFTVLKGFFTANFVAFNGDVCRELAVNFLELAEKQRASYPLLTGHSLLGCSLMLAGHIAEGSAHFDQSIALYDPVKHRPLAASFGEDQRTVAFSFRSLALWMLGYPKAALADSNHALKDAREIGQAVTLMFALLFALQTEARCGNYASETARLDELLALADEKNAQFWKTLGVTHQGCVLALTGKAAEAIATIKSGLAAIQSMRVSNTVPYYLSALGRAHAELSQFNDGAASTRR
jgi:tetratricopeptide (TPR) repeat protein